MASSVPTKVHTACQVHMPDSAEADTIEKQESMITTDKDDNISLPAPHQNKTHGEGSMTEALNPEASSHQEVVGKVGAQQEAIQIAEEDLLKIFHLDDASCKVNSVEGSSLESDWSDYDEELF